MNRRGNKKLFFLFLFVMWAIFNTMGISEDCMIGSYFIKNFSPKDYHAKLQNWSIIQDKRGVVYIANNSGIIEYNGTDFNLIKTDTIARALDVDNKGTVYVGIIGDIGYLEYDEKGQAKFKSLKEFLPEKEREFNDIFDVLSTSFGVYFILADRIFWYKGDGKFNIIKFNLISRAHVFDDIIFLQSKKGIFALYKNKIYSIPYTNSFTYRNMGTIQIIPNKGKKVFIITEKKGIFIYNLLPLLKKIRKNHNKGLKNFRNKQILIKVKSNAEKYLRRNRLYTGVKIRDDLYAIALYESKFLFINEKGELLRVCNEEMGLQNEVVLGFFVDREKNLWLALNKGFSYVEINSPFTFFDKRNGLKNVANDILLNEHTMYVSAMDGVFYLDLCGKREERRDVFKKIKNSGSVSFSLLGIKNQIFYTGDKGLYHIVKHRSFKVAGDKFYYCAGMSRKMPNTIFVGSMNGLEAFIFHKNNWLSGNFKNPEKYSFNRIRSIVRGIIEDRDGNLWFSTEKSGVGYLKFRKDGDIRYFEYYNFGKKDGLPSDISNLVFFIDGEIWVLGNDYNIYKKNEKIKNGRKVIFFEKYNRVNSFLKKGNEIGTLYEDRLGNVWIGQKGNFLCLKKDKKGKFYKVGNYLKEINETFLKVQRRNNYLWISTTEGIYRLNLDIKRNLNLKLSTLITRVIINNRENYFFGTFFKGERRNIPIFEQTPSLTPILPYKKNSLYFEFSLPFYTHKEGNRYSYKLEGYDKEWSEWVGFTKKEYTNLPPGDYIFRVKAKNIFGIVAKEASFKFTILPPWYMTWYAYIFYIIMGAFFVYLILLFNNKRHLRAKEKLERIIKERTVEIERQKKKLEELATQDSLTGVFNKRKFNEVFNHEWKRAERNGRYIGILMVDVDFFKQYNDTYGHQAGDEALRKVAHAIKSVVKRPADFVARYGGEEFIVLLPETDPEGVKAVGEKIRRAVENLKIPHEKSTVSEYLTVSVGAISVIPRKDFLFSLLIKAADDALYESKRNGRNRVSYKDEL